jgi:hypothetical protein
VFVLTYISEDHEALSLAHHQNRTETERKKKKRARFFLLFIHTYIL